MTPFIPSQKQIDRVMRMVELGKSVEETAEYMKQCRMAHIRAEQVEWALQQINGAVPSSGGF